MRFLLCVVALLLGTAVVWAAPLAEPVAAPVATEPADEKDGLKISISSTALKNGAGRVIELNPADPHISVVLQNTSSHSLGIFNRDVYTSPSLMLVITSIDREPLTTPIVFEGLFFQPEPGMHDSSRGISEIQSLSSKDVWVREIPLTYPANPNSRKVWFLEQRKMSYGHFPLPGKSHLITMHVEYIAVTSFVDHPNFLWLGSIASAPQEYHVQWLTK